MYSSRVFFTISFFQMRILRSLFILAVCTSTAFSVTTVENEVKESPKSEQNTEQIVENLNQIQFSLSKIMATRNKAVLEAELSDVLNHIDPQSLGNDEVIGAYEYLLNTLAKLKMTQSQRDALAIEIKRKRSYVKWEAASNIGNAIIASGLQLTKAASAAAAAAATGGATIPAATKDVGAALSTLANMTVFTLLNIKKLHSEITTDSVIRFMALDDAELEAIDHERRSLFVASARALKDRDKSENLIQENEMTAFGELITMLDDSTNVGYVLNILENEGYRKKFENFAPYQHALIKAYFLKNDGLSYNKMKDFYDSTKGNHNVYNKQNPLARESARYMAIMALRNSDTKSLENYFNDLKNAIPQIPEEKINFHFFAFPIYMILRQEDNAKNSLEFLKKAGQLTKESPWNYQYYCKLTDKGNPNFCKKADSVWKAIDSLKIDSKDSEHIRYGCFFKDAVDTIDYEVLENTYEYEITKENTGIIKKTLNASKKGFSYVYGSVVNVVNNTVDFANDVLDKDEKKCLETLESNDTTKINEYNAKSTHLQIRTIITTETPLYTLKAHKYGDRANDRGKTRPANGLVIETLKYKF